LAAARFDSFRLDSLSKNFRLRFGRILIRSLLVRRINKRAAIVTDVEFGRFTDQLEGMSVGKREITRSAHTVTHFGDTQLPASCAAVVVA